MSKSLIGLALKWRYSNRLSCWRATCCGYTLHVFKQTSGYWFYEVCQNNIECEVARQFVGSASPETSARAAERWLRGYARATAKRMAQIEKALGMP